jgi:hypothetical protein
VRDYAAAQKSDTARFAAFFREMLRRGILLPPSQFEALFVSSAHSDADIDATISAASASLSAITGRLLVHAARLGTPGREVFSFVSSVRLSLEPELYAW